jgi:hypothetical protein
MRPRIFCDYPHQHPIRRRSIRADNAETGVFQPVQDYVQILIVIDVRPLLHHARQSNGRSGSVTGRSERV